MDSLVPVEIIEKKIFLIRGKKVMLDADLAELYGVETFNLNKAVKRNIERFPTDFMFQVTKDELESLKFQSRKSNSISENGTSGTFLTRCSIVGCVIFRHGVDLPK
jgi:hypothetical protein